LSAPTTTKTNCQALPSNTALVCVYDGTDSAVTINGNPLDTCKLGYKIEIASQFSQQLFLPLIGNYLGNNGSTDTRLLTADAEATCEQN
jgi:hypothetical protein